MPSPPKKQQKQTQKKHLQCKLSRRLSHDYFVKSKQ